MENSLAIMSNAAKMLAEANTIQKTKELINLALTAADWAKRKGMGEETIQYCKSYAIEAERKMGELLKATPRNKGAAGVGPIAVPEKYHNAPTLAELDITKKESSEAQFLVSLTKEEFEEVKTGQSTVGKVKKERAKNEKKKKLDEIKNKYIEIIPDEMLGTWPIGIVSQVSDSCEALAQLPDNSINLIFTDPPYNLDKDYGEDISDNRPDYMDWCKKWFTEVARILVPGGSFYVMHYPETCAVWKPILDNLLTYRRWISWVYNSNIGHGPDNWRRSHRTILYYTKGKAYFDGVADPQPYKNPTDSRVAKLSQEGTIPYDWWEYDLVKNVSNDKYWPNQLPVQLVSRIVKTSSAPGDIVLDPFMGSGTTAIAAYTNDRRWIGFDKNSSSAAITSERLRDMK